MNKLYSVLILMAGCSISYGQISLNSSLAPPVNTMYIYHDANQPSPSFVFSTTGTNNTWDFTGITSFPGSEDTVFYFPPSDYPQAGSAFPSATHATYEGGDGSVTFLTIDVYSATFLGSLGDPFGNGNIIPLIANPPGSTMTFPWTYGSSTSVVSSFDIYATGAAIGQPNVDSVHYKSTGYFDADVPAYGDIVLPAGTYPALLERRITTTVDSGWFKSAAMGNVWQQAPNTPTTSTDSSFYWYGDQTLQHLAHALYDDTGVMHDVHYYMSQLSTGVELVENKKQLNVFPNPTRDFLGVNGLSFPAESKWSIYNIAGQELINGNFSLNTVNVQSLPQGDYILHLITPTGEVHDVRFVKN